MPFDDVTYPMDMSAEWKCFNLGCGCKVKEFFCVKRACRSSDAMFFWDSKADFKCFHNFCDKDASYYHFEVDDDDELDRKRLMLSILLQCEVGDDLDIKFIEKVVADKTQVIFYPSVINKNTDSRHIDFDWTTADHTSKAAFCTQISEELEMSG